MKKAKIMVHCLVQNEGHFIWYAINSVLPFVDKMMVWDMSSTDGTDLIIQTIKSAKIEYQKVPPGTPDGLTRQRQRMLDETPGEYTWIMILDGDEVWPEKSIKIVTDFVKNHPEFESIVVRTNNLVGDIYHRLPESSGHYALAGHRGHLALRLMNRELVKGLHVSLPHGTQGFFDSNNVLVQDRDPKKIKFIDVTYHHATHLQRSSLIFGDNEVSKRRQKLKFELGEKIPTAEIPKIFFEAKRPKIIPTVSEKANLYFWIISVMQTLPRRLKRKLINGSEGY